MRFLQTNNRNWKRLCKGEIQAKQVEFKECEMVMTKDDEGKTIKVTTIDTVDECYGIDVGDTGEIDSIEPGIILIRMTSGVQKGMIFPMDASQLKIL